MLTLPQTVVSGRCPAPRVMCSGADPIHSGAGMSMSDTTLGLLSAGAVLFVVLCIAVVIIKRTVRRRRKRRAIRYGNAASPWAAIPGVGGGGDTSPNNWSGGTSIAFLLKVCGICKHVE